MDSPDRFVARDYDTNKYIAKTTGKINVRNGTYFCYWSAYNVTIDFGEGEIYELRTDVGVRCPFPVMYEMDIIKGTGFIKYNK